MVYSQWDWDILKKQFLGVNKQVVQSLRSCFLLDVKFLFQHKRINYKFVLSHNFELSSYRFIIEHWWINKFCDNSLLIETQFKDQKIYKQKMVEMIDHQVFQFFNDKNMNEWNDNINEWAILQSNDWTNILPNPTSVFNISWLL